ncbi:hypothetical protein CerSpe_257180 [Prunus speciosa]
MDPTNPTDQTDQTENTTPLTSASAVDQGAAVLIRGMDLDVFNAAKGGKTDVLRAHGPSLDQILTPTKNTVLHIYTAFASSPTLVEPKENALKPTRVVKDILQICPALLLQENESGETALHIAARHGRTDIVKLLIRTARARPRDLERGFSPEEDLKMFLRATNKEKDTALHEAARFNQLGVAEILSREDPDFSYSANNAGETPLYLAAERRYRDVFYKILNTCNNPTYEGPIGRTALHAAVIYGKESIQS